MTATSTPLDKTTFFQDLWSEVSTITLYLGETTFAVILFCTLFNRPGDFLTVGTWLLALGFSTYFACRLAGYLTIKLTFLTFINLIWLLSLMVIFTRFFLFAHSPLSFWQMIMEPFINLNKQPVLQSQLWQLFFIILYIKRAFTLAGSTSNSWRAIRSFQVGMLVFFFYGFTTTWDNFLANLIPFLLYLLFAIIALTTARLASISNQPGKKVAGLNRSWFVWILILTLAIITIGLSIGWLTGVAFVTFTAWLLRIAYGMGVSLLVLFFSPLIALIGLLLPWLNRLLESITQKPIGLDQLAFIQSLNNPDPVKAAQVNDIINQILTVFLIILLLITALIVIISSRRRALRNQINPHDEQILRANRQKTKRPHVSLFDFLDPRFAGMRKWLAAARIRHIYQNLMEYCDKLDTPRLPAFTPHEFLPQLVSLFPGYSSQLLMLTDVYQRVRYGEIPETAEELQPILIAWKEIKKEAEIRVRERKKRLKKL